MKSEIRHKITPKLTDTRAYGGLGETVGKFILCLLDIVEERAVPPPSEKKEALKYHFNAIKTAFNASAEIIIALEGEEKTKYRAAMLKLADGCRSIIEGI